MLNLFNEQTGFRLARLELYNWGTFDSQIWVMTPDCHTAVLTGQNGSGKSTVVDALLTLLVDGRQRNYNLASGANNSRERTERTYVLGQYSRSRGDTAIDARANTLRGTDSYSVLLAVFYDAAHDRTVTLAQVLWISNVPRVEKRYCVASCELSIEEHFLHRHVSMRDLPEGVLSFGSTFKDYIATARKVLGLSGKPKALDLFNETVAVKDIPSLNTFVRDHMLDKGDPEQQVEVLKAQYRELNEAHTAIQRAGRQLGILAPLMEAGKEYRREETRITRYEAAKSLIQFYVEGRAKGLLADEIQSKQTLRKAEQSRLAVVEERRKSLHDNLREVRLAIDKDDVGQSKRNIERQLVFTQKRIAEYRRVAERYDENARLAGLPPYQHEEDFYNNRHRAEEMQQTTTSLIQELETERADLHVERRNLAEREEELDKETQYLRENLSNIPANVARIREMIAAEFDLPAEDLPFVGELLQVRKEDSAWEGALERLLHSFAQDLIVPESLYHRVSHYVNEHNLRGRLVYRRVDPAHNSGPLPEHRGQYTTGAMAHEKLQIKPGTPYHDWLVASLMQKFAYVCCESLTDFQRADRAITQQGQIKHGASRHEKDDRRDLGDRRHYVLGWDNREKLRQIEAELDEVRHQLNRAQERHQHISDQLERQRLVISALDKLLLYETFSEIDWRSHQIEYDRLRRELESLDDSHLSRLEQQRDDLERQIDEVEERRDAIKAAITRLETQIDTHERRLNKAEQRLAAMTAKDKQLWHEVGSVIGEIDKEPLQIENLDSRAHELEASVQGSIANFRGYQNQFQMAILDAMNTFRREYPDEAVSLTADIASLEAFEGIYARLANDDLPQYEERFKELLDRKVVHGLRVFHASLGEQERAIERSIEELNESLAQVDYGGGSVIQLIAERTPDPEINDFRRTLSACIPDMGDSSQEELERAYNQIEALIERFDADPGWMRRVIDVRRWRIFAAEQIDSNGNQVDYYSDSSGKSGGQKAKLAYTILASAIAYQYGLQDPISNDRSFRLVVIDEAFSKLDEDNARFAMQLFDQLGLQLLVVTPMQQLHVIEDYVKAYHLVVNNDEGSCSQLYNLTEAEYRERRREWQWQAGRV